MLHLVLGAGGFIGRSVAALLMARGDHVRLVTRTRAAALSGTDNPRVESITADLRDVDWEALLRDVSVVHHYAWSTIPQTADRDPVGDVTSNICVTLQLLEALRRKGEGRLIFSSSGGTVYGRLQSFPVPEDHPLNPLSIYGAGKVAAENYIAVFRRLHGVDARVARLANPFGPGQAPEKNQGAASIFLHRYVNGEPITIYGDGNVVRDYLYVTDAAEALVALADAPLAGDEPHVFNVGTGVGTSLNDILTVLSQVVGRTPPIRREQARGFDVPVSVLDVSRARQMLGWSPRRTFQEGIELMMQAAALEDHGGSRQRRSSR